MMLLKRSNSPKMKILSLVLAMAVISLLSASAFAQSGGLKGRIRNDQGKGIPGASVTLQKDGNDVKSTKADDKGNFLLSGLKAGEYTLIVDASGYVAGTIRAVEIKADKVRDLGSRLMLNVDPGTLMLLRGSVFFREGTSVPGAKIEIERIAADGTAKKVSSTYTGLSGEFVYRGPDAAATYRVTAKFKGVTGTKDITVEHAAIYRLAISLDMSKDDQ